MAAVETGMSSRAAVAMKNFSFHSDKVNERERQLVKTSASMTDSCIVGVTKAVVEDFATYISPGFTAFTDA